MIVFIRFAAFISLLFIIWASIVPGELRPTAGAKGVVEHMAAYAVCAFLFGIGFAQFRAAFICIALALMAGLLEVFQHYIPGRNGRLLDAFMSSAGAGLGLLTVLAARAINRGGPGK